MKIGIITHYYNSKNYGGNLQSYALVETMHKMGFNVEQISYVHQKRNIITDQQSDSKSKVLLLKKIITRFWKIPIVLYRKHIEKNTKKLRQDRADSFVKFNMLIPHSDKVYDCTSIMNCYYYDAFVTGSDQVWNLTWYHPAYFLDFVPAGKKKISYAASVSMDSFTDEQREIVKNSLSSFDAISVREEKAVELIQPLVDQRVEVHLDPTLLLSREDWDEVCADRVVKDRYVFCYFLGDNKASRKCVNKYAKKHNLRIVNLAHMNYVKLNDLIIKDIEVYGVGPEKFISLIKHAECVFTDSFHAVVFSNIYEKQFFVFNRDKARAMSSRIYNITQLFHEEERFCDSREKECIKYIDSLNDIDYTRDNREFEEMKERSLHYLRDNLSCNE